MARGLLVGLLTCAVLLVLGAVVGLAAVVLHTWWWGLMLGAAATLVGGYALRPGWSTRLPYAVGWLVPLGLAMVPRPEGDYLVAGDLSGYLLIAVGMVLIVLTTATLPLGRRTAPATGAGTDAEAVEAPTAATGAGPDAAPVDAPTAARDAGTDAEPVEAPTAARDAGSDAEPVEAPTAVTDTDSDGAR